MSTAKPSALSALLTAVLTVLCAVLYTVPAFAEGQALDCVMSAEDAGNGYEYQVEGIGTFTVNCQENEVVPIFVFEAYDGCYAALYQAGRRIESDGLVYEPGRYELRVYGSETMDGDYGSFYVTVENEYNEMEPEEIPDLTEVKNPGLDLRWNADRNVFRYSFPDGAWFETNVPLGGWSRGAAQITADDKLHVYQVYRDGEIVGIGDELDFNEVGGYEIILRDNELGSRGSTAYSAVMTFRLYKNENLCLSRVNTPMGLKLVSARKDGERLDVADTDCIQLTRDGRYALEYADSSGTICWSMEFVRDTTPPMLRFNVPMDGEPIREDVAFSPSELGADIYLERNNSEVTASLNIIRINGRYHMEVSDPAGNMRSYDFTVTKSADIDIRSVIVIVLALLALLAGGFVYWRRSMRVR